MMYTDLSGLPPQLRSLVESEMQPGERITWMEQPIPSRMARKTLPIVLFAIPWTAFAVFWMAAAGWGTAKAEDGHGLFGIFPLFGVPFVLIGIGMLLSPLWARRNARRSAYVITDRRAILFTAGWSGSVTVRSFGPDRLTDLRRRQHADGSGDLVFAQDIHRNSDGERHSADVGFLAIREVKAVEELIRGLAHKVVR